VQPADYALFLDCVKETIWRFDKEHWPEREELDRAWELVVKDSLDVLQRR